MFYASLQIPRIATSTKQADSDRGSYAYLQSLQDAGLLKEGDLTAEAMDQGLQCSEMVKLVVRALDPEAADEQSEALRKKAVASGLLDGEQEGQALTKTTATRAEAVVVLCRLLLLLGVKTLSGS